MKRVFFMVGILAALSMTAFGKEVGSVNKSINITGTAVPAIEITGPESVVFGKVVVGSTQEKDIELTLKGDKNQNVKLKSNIASLSDKYISFSTGKGITDDEKVLLDGTGNGKKALTLKYAPRASGSLTATLTVTASYDDTDSEWIK